MAELKHRVSPDVANALRRAATNTQPHPDDLRIAEAAGVFLPIDRGVLETARASCRACGRKIENGAHVVRFQFDPHRATGGWGQLREAFLHIECPPEER